MCKVITLHGIRHLKKTSFPRKLSGEPFIPAGTKLQVEVRKSGLAHVNSYIRIQNVKPLKVRYYYRRSQDAKVVSVRIRTK